MKKNISAIDLFCGVGGLTQGLEKAGISVEAGIDIDPACKYPYTANNNAKFLLKSITDIDYTELMEHFNDSSIKLLAGCAPCQTFSSYNQKADSTDERWWLLLRFAELIKQIKPELVTMENVPGLLEQEVFIKFLSTLEELNYNVHFQIVNCVEYGLPQYRNRLVLLASQFGPIELISSHNYRKRNVRDEIGKFPPINAGEVSHKDQMHQSAALSSLNLQRIKASTPGGTWRDWPEHLVANCHKRNSGKTYPSVYGRMSWDEPSPTITTQFYGFGNGRFGHPEQNRAISLREGAILQGFPKNYKFFKPGTTISRSAVGRMIGNAVPVKLGEVIGKSIIRHVNTIDVDN